MADIRAFQRSLRLVPELPKGEVEIPAPPPALQEPSLSMAAVLWPMVPGLLGAVIMYAIARANGANAVMYVAYTLPMLAGGYLVQVGHHYFQKRKYHEDVHKREERFRSVLREQRGELQRAADKQREALRDVHPTPRECMARAESLSPRLWERAPGDADFLALRAGVGPAPFALTVKAPRPSQALEPDPLVHEATALATEFEQVAGVPVALPLAAVQIAGVVGPGPVALKVARSLLLQLTTHHSPDEVKVVGIFAAREAADWAWMRWLPHVWSEDRRRRFLAADEAGAAELLDSLQEVLARRRQALTVNRRERAEQPLPVFVFVVGDQGLIRNHPILSLLLQDGAEIGAFMVCVAGRRSELPKECGGFAELTESGGQLILTRGGRPQSDFFPDEVPPELPEQLARTLAPVRLQQTGASAEIPQVVTLLDLLGVDRVEELDLLARWQRAAPEHSMAVPIGQGAGGKPVLLDLHDRAHGPHGLVAGATGSGKSELLQTYIAVLAASYHPHDVTFLAVDYKGGGMANVFRGLPHLVGTLTNLEGGLAKRAMVALKAELRRRQRMLADEGITHIDEYLRRRRQGKDLTPLPHLIVVVDEFAELKKEQPDFMGELISTVRLGRSLGVHLILATQKPAGVVDDQIWSNARFRLCLRVEQPEDSQEVIRRPDAADIVGRGRAYFQVGNNERFELFQAGWGGAPYLPDRRVRAGESLVMEVALDGSRMPVGLGTEQAAPVCEGKQLQALVAHMADVARASIAPLDSPWQEPLPELIFLEQVRKGEQGWDGHAWAPGPAWLAPCIGMVDDPAHQRQGELRVDLGKGGHLALYGAPGVGKKTLVQTLITALALDHTPAEVQIYLVDCSSRALRFLRGLPHVGDVVLLEERERLERLFHWLAGELERRKGLLARAGVSTMAAYRQTGADPLPALVLVVENFAKLLEEHEPVAETVLRLAREGGNHGLHLVLTATGPSGLYRVANDVGMALSLRLTDKTDYAMIVGQTYGLEPMPVPGRGLVRGTPPLEFQAALPHGGATEWERTQALKALFERMDQAWQGPRPEPVRVLPDVVPLTDILALDACRAKASWEVPVGLEVESLAPLLLDATAGTHVLIGGPAGSGKSTLLQTWLLSLAAHRSEADLHLWLVDFGQGALGALRPLPHVRGLISDEEQFLAMAGQVDQEMELRRTRREGEMRSQEPLLVIAVDNFDLFRGGLSDEALARVEVWARRCRGLGLSLMAAGPTDALDQFDGLGKGLKECQTGVILGTSSLDLFGLRPVGGERLLPPGQGYYVHRGETRAMKAATPHAGPLTLAGWLKALRGGSEVRT